MLLAEEGPDRLYRIADLPRTRVRTLLFALPWSELTFVSGPSPGSYLRGSYSIAFLRTFGLQGPGQFLAYLRKHQTGFTAQASATNSDDRDRSLMRSLETS